MLRKIFNPPDLPPTGGRYSQIVRAEGKSMLFISGQVALDAKGQLVGSGDFSAQAEQVFRNLKAALDSEGASFRDVVKITTYVTDMTHRDDLQKVRSKYFSSEPPASTLVGVTALANPEFMLEIEAIAILD